MSLFPKTLNISLYWDELTYPPSKLKKLKHILYKNTIKEPYSTPRPPEFLNSGHRKTANLSWSMLTTLCPLTILFVRISESPAKPTSGDLRRWRLDGRRHLSSAVAACSTVGSAALDGVGWSNVYWWLNLFDIQLLY